MDRPCPALVLTRDAAGCRAWARDLRRLGGRAILFPCLEIRPIDGDDVAAPLRSALGRARWLCVTSPRGVDALGRFVDSVPASLRIAAVGPATATRARECWGRVDLEAEISTARGLADALWRLDGPAAGPVVVVTADRGRRDVETALGGRGVAVERFELYSTVPSPPAARRESLLDLLARDAAPVPDVVTVASPSAFEGLCNRAELPAELPIVTLGPTTTAAVRRAGADVAAEARRPTIEALYAAAVDVAGS